MLQHNEEIAMGLFDFFRSFVKKEEAVPTHSEEFFVITGKPEKELFECYDEIFNAMIRDVSGLSRKDTTDILHIIKKSKDGFINDSGYGQLVWEKYFNGKDWAWNEYEKWNETFQKTGMFPLTFPAKAKFRTYDVDDALNELKVVDLKILCNQHKAIVPNKAKKKDMIVAIRAIPDIHKLPIVSEKIESLNNGFSRSIYALFMRTAHFRATNLYNFRCAQKAGIKRFEIIHSIKEDKKFVEMALKQNPNAIHPIYPSDLSFKIPIVDLE